jgi:short-subunit dehydrogenase
MAQSKNRVVLITGASAGIGAAAVEVFATAGFDVVLAARRKERLEKIAATLGPKYSHTQLVPVICDVSSDESVSKAFDFIREKFGKLDVLVNNAGYGVYATVEKSSLDTYRANMETNFFGTIRCTQAALPLLREAAKQSSKRWGAAIVMISSILGRRAMPLMSAYCASKFAMEGLSESLRLELYDERISVSVVNPGATKTEFGDAAEGTRPATFLSSEKGMTSEAVAKVILSAVRRPRRNAYLTLPGKACILTQWLAPRVLDHALLDTWRKARDEQARGKP